MNWLDSILAKITMYRLMLYYLLFLVIVAMVLGGLKVIPYNPFALLVTAGLAVSICWGANKLIGKLLKIPTNIEAPLITGLILSLIITPSLATKTLGFIALAGLLAMVSKYVVAIRRAHIFNPAALAVAITFFTLGLGASWWAGTFPMLPAVVAGGVLVARKIQRGRMIATFVAAALISTTVLALLGHADVASTLRLTLLSSPLFYFGFVMFPEPLTSPATWNKQIWYAAVTGAVFPPAFHVGPIFATPELALLVGNAVAFVISSPVRLLPKLVAKNQLAPDTWEFVFNPSRKFKYQAGQYLEWTLPGKAADDRGNRRYFTLASSPTENDLHIGVKFYPEGSTFKHALEGVTKDSMVAAGRLGGDFTLPKNSQQKLAFLAGGIGITPYRSMLKYLIDTGDKRAVTLVYSEKNDKELVFRDIISAAEKQLGAKVVYTLSDKITPPPWAHSGIITSQLIRDQIPDFAERLFYISGPHGMVVAMEKLLLELGVRRSHIKIDFFPGYA